MTKHYEQRKDANKRHLEKLDQVTVRPPKGTKERWRAAADAAGVSLQAYIIAAVEAAVELQEQKKER